MDEHTLPPDSSSWPRDPYRLLGVTRGVSAKDLRRAYLRLIKSYKPEHSPEEFRLIRAAYETIQAFAAPDNFEAVPVEVSTSNAGRVEPGETEPEVFARPAPQRDPWDLAVEGQVDQAYRELVDQAAHGLGGEGTFLRLYWLLELRPELDPGRQPNDWLVRGLMDRGSTAYRLRELLAREVGYNPALAVDDRLKELVARDGDLALMQDVCRWRWGAARRLGRWDVIREDLLSLRAWLADADDHVYATILIAAATAMAWATEENRAQFQLMKAAAERAASERLDMDNELHRLELVDRAASGLLRLWPKHEYALELHGLLRQTWNQPGPIGRNKVLALLVEVSNDPSTWFTRLTQIQVNASAALQLLAELPDQFGIGRASAPDRVDMDDINAAVLEFLDAQKSWEFSSLRGGLMKFCLTEMIPPRLVSLSATRRFEARTFASEIAADWALAMVYRCVEIVRV